MPPEQGPVGWWWREAGLPGQRPRLEGEISADVLVVGGGFTGLWSAWLVKELEPEARVVLVEAERIGGGPSGRNGGFVNGMWFSLPGMRRRFGDEAALAVARASQEAIDAVGRWCEEQEVDAWFRRGGYLQVSTTPRHDGAWDATARACAELGVAEECAPEPAPAIARRCASPVFRGGAWFRGAATVQPARLVRGLAERLAGAGVEIYERSPVRRLRGSPAGAVAETPQGRVRAGAAILATGPASIGLAPLERRLTLTTSHMLITEPVPDVVEELGWTGGEAITDSRHMLHYTRTTPDGRIAFGWGAGHTVPGGRWVRQEDDPTIAVRVRADLERFFPQLEGRRTELAWGGPIDVSPTHTPVVGSIGADRVHYAFGYTGNGVGPSRMCARALASLALDHRDEHSRLAIVEPAPALVPPEPIRWLGGELIREALLRREEAEEADREAGLATRAVAALPDLFGIQIGR